MNKINLIFITGIILMLTSCNKEVNNQNLETSSQDIELRTAVNPIIYADLQWTSYIIAGMLLEDDADLFQSQFVGISTTGTVMLSDLFDDPDFDSRFTELAYIYFEEEVSNDNDRAIAPKNKPARPPRGIHNNLHKVDETRLLLNAIKSYECAELYFPERLSFNNTIVTITSTGHPLNSDLVSEGYKWELGSSEPDYYFDVSFVNIDNQYVYQNRNVIVARLVNSAALQFAYNDFSDDCRYVNNNTDINFTEFLSGE